MQQYGIGNYLCIYDKSNISFQGDYYADVFRYININLIKCNGSTC